MLALGRQNCNMRVESFTKSTASAWPASAAGTSGRSTICNGVSLNIATTMPTPVGGEATKR